MHQVGRGLPRPQRHALQVERGLGDLVLALDQQLDLEPGEIGDLLADARREALLHVLPEPVRDGVLRPLISIFTIDLLDLVRQWLAPHATWRAGSCANRP